MDLTVSIPYDGVSYRYPLLRSADFQRIELSGVVILDIFKIHNHRYELFGFFYRQKIILGPSVYSSKKGLYGAIQKFLQQYL